jgi:hypothetical protein
MREASILLFRMRRFLHLLVHLIEVGFPTHILTRSLLCLVKSNQAHQSKGEAGGSMQSDHNRSKLPRRCTQ